VTSGKRFFCEKKAPKNFCDRLGEPRLANRDTHSVNGMHAALRHGAVNTWIAPERTKKPVYFYGKIIYRAATRITFLSSRRHQARRRSARMQRA
jgi:hypothetical protein